MNKFNFGVLTLALMGTMSFIDQSHASGTSKIFTNFADFEKTVNVDTSVTRKPVTFTKKGLKISGLLFTPSNLDESKKHSAIVVVHPGGGIKEQTASVYAYNLAKEGYVAIAFDAAFQGASEGEPRGLEDPASRVEDVRSAVDYLTTLPFVDREKIGALGICAGGGYAIAAATTEKRIKAVAGVSAVDFGISVRNGWRNTSKLADQLKTLEAVSKQRTDEANGAKPFLVNYVPEQNEITKATDPDMIEASNYYRQEERWMHKNAGNRFLFRSLDQLTAFSAFDRVDTLLNQPLLVVAGSNAGSLWQSQKVYKLAKGKKDLYIVKDGTHMSLYDKDVNKVVPKLTEFYNKNLK